MTPKSLGPWALVSLLLAGSASGCHDPTTGTPKATIGAPAASSGPAPDGVAYAITPMNSQIHWTGSKVTGRHDGAFGAFSGSVVLVGGAVDKSRVAVDIETKSISTVPENLVKHLKTSDFFDVETYPKASFASTAIRPLGQDNFAITGNLTLHGVTKAITFPANIQLVGDSIVTEATFSLNRKEFGVNYPGKANDIIRDDVLIELNIHAEKQG